MSRWDCSERGFAMSDEMREALTAYASPVEVLRRRYWSESLHRALAQPRCDAADFLDELEGSREKAGSHLAVAASVVRAAVGALDEDAEGELVQRVAEAVAGALGLAELANRAAGLDFSCEHPVLAAQLSGVSDDVVSLLLDLDEGNANDFA